MRFFLCFLLGVSFCGDLNATFDYFLFKGSIPKCCGRDEALFYGSSEYPSHYYCAYNENQVFHVETNSTLPAFPGNPATESPPHCIEFAVNKTSGEGRLQTIDYVHLSVEVEHHEISPLWKCCPVNHSYDPVTHKCITISGTTSPDSLEGIIKRRLENGSVFLKHGFRECNTGAIIDYRVSSFDASFFSSNNKEIYLDELDDKFNYGQYCVDDVHNSEEFIVRVCYHDASAVCRGRKKGDFVRPKCIRKCCLDGQVYRHGECVTNFRVGLNLTENVNVHNPGEPFGIIPGNDCFKKICDRDDYYVDDRGVVHVKVYGYPELTYSPFRDSYCLESIDEGERKMLGLMLCLDKTVHD